MNTQTKKNKMKDNKIKNVVTANIGDRFMIIEQEKAIANSDFNTSKFVISGKVIMCKRGLNEDFTEYELNDKFTVRRNSTGVKKPGEVIFDEDEALDLVNELNEKELSEVKKSIKKLEEIKSILEQVNKLYSNKDSLNYDSKGKDIEININLDSNKEI